MVMYCDDTVSPYEIEMALMNANIEVIYKNQITIDHIINVVCKFYNILPENLIRESRERVIIEPRQVAHYYARLLTRESLENIGKQIGDKDHATVRNSIVKIDNLIETDKAFRKKIKTINSMFGIV